MRTLTLPVARIGPRSKRLLALAHDERLVDQIRRGDELAFEVAFERHSPAILSFCRHMLGSREEAEDAVQQAFASAYHDLGRDDRAINLKPWLFAIARNRCLSMLRARREHTAGEREIATAGLAEQVERRGELRDLLHDLDDLPEQQRAALLLSEVSGLAHAEIADVLGCQAHKVKALVFRARSGLIERRDARETPCEEIREQLANLRGGSLRRAGLRHHLRVCPGCTEYRAQLKRQRRMLAAVLPVIPSVGLKESVLGAIGLGGGSAAGGGLLGGLGVAASGQAGTAGMAKLAMVGVLAAGGTVAGDAVVKHSGADPSARAPVVRNIEGPRLAGGGSTAGARTDAAQVPVDSPGGRSTRRENGHGARDGAGRGRHEKGAAGSGRKHAAPGEKGVRSGGKGPGPGGKGPGPGRNGIGSGGKRAALSGGHGAGRSRKDGTASSGKGPVKSGASKPGREKAVAKDSGGHAGATRGVELPKRADADSPGRKLGVRAK
jgi:RNA polymerase sigma factor (sigma-70 family)